MTDAPIILVADHHPEMLQLIEIVFKHEGYTVITAHSGAEAIEKVKSEEKIDLVILEAVFPDIQGVDICRAITEQYPDRFIPVIITTARADLSSVIAMLRVGANDYIVKPFAIDELEESVRSNLQKARERLLRGVRTDAVIMEFNFPEMVKVSCEQYLLYFVEFLRDIGIDATADLREDAGQVLFSVTPKDKDEALDNIREALEIYLRLPLNRNNAIVVSPETSIEVQKLSAQLGMLQVQFQLANATIQQKEIAIQQRDTVIYHQQKLLDAGQVLIEARHEEKQNDTEPIIGNVVRVKKADWDGIPIEVDLPTIVRWMKEKFGRKR